MLVFGGVHNWSHRQPALWVTDSPTNRLTNAGALLEWADGNHQNWSSPSGKQNKTYRKTRYMGVLKLCILVWQNSSRLRMFRILDGVWFPCKHHPKCWMTYRREDRSTAARMSRGERSHEKLRHRVAFGGKSWLFWVWMFPWVYLEFVAVSLQIQWFVENDHVIWMVCEYDWMRISICTPQRMQTLQHIGETRVEVPYHPGMVHIYLHLVDFYGKWCKCVQIYYT